jgi:hypothetical protein
MKLTDSKFTRAILALIAGLLLSGIAARAQNCNNPSFPPSNVTITQDRDQMMCQLGITFPPGLADCRLDPNRPVSRNARPNNAAAPCGNWTDDSGYTITRSGFGLWNNYDDYPGTLFPGGSQPWRTGGYDANGVYKLVDLLKMNDGTPVKTIQQWWTQRRPEIAHDLQDQLYGFDTTDVLGNPAIVWTIGTTTTGTANGVAYKQKNITGTIDISRYPSVRNRPRVTGTVRVPSAATGPVPLIITISGTASGDWPYVAPAGYGIMQFNYSALQPDNGTGLTSYIIGLMSQGNWRQPSDWGVLRAWGWGISRLIDYFEQATDGWVDATKVGMEGHSRWGKATLLAMAFEPRLAIGYPSCGGSLGTKMNTRHWGQNLENSSWDQEYHWMNGNWFKFMGPLVDPGNGTGTILADGSGPGTYLPRKQANLTVDTHSLYAMVAPRPVFTNAGTNDSWEDGQGEFMAAVLGGPPYQFLGKQPLQLGGDALPVIDKAYISGDIGFRYHNGGHTDVNDWPAFIQFCQKYWSNPNAPPSYDITSNAAFFKSGYTVNTIQHTFTGTVQITNNTAMTMNAPLYFVVKGLPAGVTLVTASGTTHDGYPEIALPGSLSSGQVATITVKFSSAPGLIVPNYTAALYSSL